MHIRAYAIAALTCLLIGNPSISQAGDRHVGQLFNFGLGIVDQAIKKQEAHRKAVNRCIKLGGKYYTEQEHCKLPEKVARAQAKQKQEQAKALMLLLGAMASSSNPLSRSEQDDKAFRQMDQGLGEYICQHGNGAAGTC